MVKLRKTLLVAMFYVRAKLLGRVRNATGIHEGEILGVNAGLKVLWGRRERFVQGAGC